MHDLRFTYIFDARITDYLETHPYLWGQGQDPWSMHVQFHICMLRPFSMLAEGPAMAAASQGTPEQECTAESLFERALQREITIDTVRVDKIGRVKPCMTDIYLHI